MKRNGGTDFTHELKKIAAEADELIGSSGEDMNEKAKDIRDRLAAVLEVVQETVGDLEERASEGLKEVDKSIRANPYPAIAIAIGLGLAAGLLLKRK
jgi:ElaB/YqjD/DUF883 family membrane-anchored ribosome-binding protein